MQVLQRSLWHNIGKKTKKRKSNDTFGENQNAKVKFFQSMCFAAPGVSLTNCLLFESISTHRRPWWLSDYLTAMHGKKKNLITTTLKGTALPEKKPPNNLLLFRSTYKAESISVVPLCNYMSMSSAVTWHSTVSTSLYYFISFFPPSQAFDCCVHNNWLGRHRLKLNNINLQKKNGWGRLEGTRSHSEHVQ